MVPTTLAPSGADCLETSEPEPPVTFGACRGLCMISFTFIFNCNLSTWYSQTTFLKCIIWHVFSDYDL